MQPTGRELKWVGRALLLLPAIVSGCAASGSDAANEAQPAGPDLYVQAGAAAPGDGSESSPFASLAMAAEAAEPDATIFLLPGAQPLDGGIALLPGQRLIGLNSAGAPATDPAEMPRLTNTTDHLGGSIVQLSERNEVSGLRLVDLESHGIISSETDLSSTRLHHLAIEGAADSEEIIWSIRLETVAGSVRDVAITDSTFRNGQDLGGIHILHGGTSDGDYLLQRNDFSDLGGRAYHLQTIDDAHLEARILDSSADNIGLGGRNSDSILPHLNNRSEQIVLVQNYRYKNSDQVGSPSNCGLEAFIMGSPFEDESLYCTGCKLTLEILDSVFEEPVTDGIQLINFGSNTVLDVTIRNTRIVGANPQQVGGGLSLLPQNSANSGSRTKLKVENTDILDSGAFGFAVNDQGESYTAVIDFGGGELGSRGNNRILGSVQGEVRLINASAVAKSNWWGGSAPRVELEGDSSSLDAEPRLDADPRPR